MWTKLKQWVHPDTTGLPDGHLYFPFPHVASHNTSKPFLLTHYVSFVLISTAAMELKLPPLPPRTQTQVLNLDYIWMALAAGVSSPFEINRMKNTNQSPSLPLPLSADVRSSLIWKHESYFWWKQNENLMCSRVAPCGAVWIFQAVFTPADAFQPLIQISHPRSLSVERFLFVLWLPSCCSAICR